MAEQIIQDVSVNLALENYLNEISGISLEPEIINVEDSLSRIIYDDIVVNNDLPLHDKALIDGYAVRAVDIADADADNPVMLKIIGEANVEDYNLYDISAKEAVKVSKGALIPENADAVVMPEDTIAEKTNLKVFSSVLSGFQVAKQGEDVKSDDILILKQRKLRPQDIGGIIGLGYRQVKVFKKPVVSLIPTGNELVPIDIEPAKTQVIASNGYVLKASIEQLGGIGKITSIVKDNLNAVKKAILKAVEISDVVLISGGSSSGTKDYTLRAVQDIEGSKIIAHNIAMKPGGHILLATVKGKPVIGLPGHPVSNMTSFHVFAKPVIRKISGDPRSFWQIIKDTPKIEAVLTKKITSPEGKEDYVRVRLKDLDDGRITAYPFTGRSSFLSTMVRSHGIIKIPADCLALYEGDVVDVFLF